MQYTLPLVVDRVYLLAKLIKEAFASLNICFWSSGGTTLGILRHQALIPWDDDIDICIMDNEVHKLTQHNVLDSF